MADEMKLLRLISELTRLTVLGGLKWSFGRPPDPVATATNDHFPTYLECTHKDQVLGLLHRKYQDYNGEFDQFIWAERISLVFVDASGRVVWESDANQSALWSLFDAARQNAGNIDSLIDKLL